MQVRGMEKDRVLPGMMRVDAVQHRCWNVRTIYMGVLSLVSAVLLRHLIVLLEEQ